MHGHASRNRISRLVWSSVHQAWVVASELSRGRGKAVSSGLVATALSLGGSPLLFLQAGLAQAGPVGGQVVFGSANITQSGASGQSTTTIAQSSDRLSLGWQSFNVGASETVNFVQPSATALAVNRIYDTQGSQILGRINANGQVWLINPNGVLFGQGSQINVGALVASTLDTADATPGQSSLRFSGSSSARVSNLGQINAAQGGYVALLGHSVINQGSISAPSGTVALGAGSAISLNFAGSKLLGLQVEQNQLNALAENGGLIQADGGQVLLSAGARDSLLASVVNNTGIIQARTVHAQDGKIVLLGGMAAGTTKVGGTLDASAASNESPGSNGGFIETSAHNVDVADSARVTTDSAQGTHGQWLIDPYDFTIAASGGNITGTALGTALGSGGVTIQTSATGTSYTSYAGTTTTGGTSGNGDIFVKDAVTWSTGNTLTLNAYRNIGISASLTASNAVGKLALLYGQGASNGVVGGTTASYSVNAAVNLQAGSNFSTLLGGSGSAVNYTVITSLGNAGDDLVSTTNSLQGLAYSTRLAGKYVLGTDITATSTSGWNYATSIYKGFMQIGKNTANFTGTLDGLGHTITGLTINRTGAENIGLFGYTSASAVIRNLGLVGGTVAALDQVGALVGYNAGAISDSYSTANVSAAGKSVNTVIYAYAGGLVGYNTGSIIRSFAKGTVSGSGQLIGGLVGVNFGAISNSYATGAASGSTNSVGGLAGGNGSTGTISMSYATGNASATDNVGGLVGLNNYVITQSYSTGSATGQTAIGGLVGNNSHGNISDSYAAGEAKGTSQVGGLVGYHDGSGATISGSYAVGAVTDVGASHTEFGGLVGRDYTFGPIATITQSYFDSSAQGTNQSVGVGSTAYSADVTALSHDASMHKSSFGLWEFGSTKTWFIYDGKTNPLLRAFLTPLEFTVTGSKTYDGTTSASVANIGYTDTLNKVYGAATYALDSKNAGSRTVTVSGLWSTQQGYLIDTVGTLVVDKAALTVSGSTAAGKTYDGSKTATITVGTLSGFVDASSDNVSATASGTFDSQNAGLRSATATYTLVDGSGLASNYSLAQSTHSATIDKKALTVSGLTAANKTYDGTTSATVSSGAASYTGLVSGDQVSVSATGVFADKNAGSGKTVTLTSSYSGADKDNYQITGQASTTASIAQAALSYTADTTVRFTGQSFDSLTGSVSGFVAGETRASATQGRLTWNTPATSQSNAGRYAIYGAGLSAANYMFVQAALNQSALTLLGDIPLISAQSSSPAVPPGADVQATESWLRNLGPSRELQLKQSAVLQEVLVQCAGLRLPPCVSQIGWVADVALDELPIVRAVDAPPVNPDEEFAKSSP